MNKLAALAFAFGTAACGPEMPASTGGSSTVDTPVTKGSITVLDDELSFEGCDNPADCEMAVTHEACAQIIAQADHNEPVNIETFELSNCLSSDENGMQDRFDTDDSIVPEEALHHFACTELFIDSDKDEPNGGQWIVDGDSVLTRDDNLLTADVAIGDTFEFTNEISLKIGVVDENGAARWTRMPSVSKGFEYTVDDYDVVN